MAKKSSSPNMREFEGTAKDFFESQGFTLNTLKFLNINEGKTQNAKKPGSSQPGRPSRAPQQPGAGVAAPKSGDGDGQQYMPVSRMPWIPAKVGKIKMQDSFFFKEMMIARKDKGTLGLQLHWLLNQTFPYYLPKRYHQMDCKALQQCSPNGRYWANASYYMHCTQAYGGMYMLAIDDVLRSEDPFFKKGEEVTVRPFMIPEWKKKTFEGRLDLCESSDEILFDPWLILQLPYSSRLLQQWYVAFLAEVLRFQREVADFHFMTVPKELEPVAFKLGQLNNELTRHAVSVCRKLSMVINQCEPTGQIAFFLQGSLGKVKSYFSVTLAMLRFITSDECKKLMKALKQMAWNGRSSTENRYETFKENLRHGDLYHFMSLGDVPHPFAYKYWKKSSLGIPKFEDLDADVSIEMEKEHIELQYEVEIWKSIRAINPNDVLKFVEEKVIKAGKLTGASQEAMIRELRNKSVPDDDYKLMGHCYLMYHHFLATSSKEEGLRNADFGVIYQLNTLFGDLHLAVAQAALVEITELVINSKGKIKVFKIFEPDNSVPTLSIKQMLRTLENVSQDKSWEFDKLLKGLQNECARLKAKPGDYPNLEYGNDRIVQILEARIKKILLEMIEGPMGQFAGPIRLYGEMSAVQYILPCFVASFLDMDADPSVSVASKRQYLDFVHQMIKTYETCKYYECHKKHNHFVNRTTRLLDTYGQFTVISRVNVDLDKAMSGVLNLMPRRINYLLKEKFLFVLLSTVMRQCDHDTEYDIKFSSFSWPLQFYHLMCRMLSAVEAVDPEAYNSVDLSIGHCYKAFLFASMVEDLGVTHPVVEMIDPMLKEAGYRWNSKFRGEPVVLRAFENTTMEQLLGIILYTYLRNLDLIATPIKPKQFEFVQRFTPDPVQVAFFNVMEGKLWELKLMVSKWLSAKNGELNLSMITFKEAKARENCYKNVLSTLTPDGKVQMKKPGQINFCPIQHCRWCGQAEGVKNFILCDMCLDTPEYPDKNFFCSMDCSNAMQEQHKDEHEEFLLKRLTLSF
ncbi:uncharacterized protein LOC132205676 [Neocloeon triangulifer]|uniref:uncharacterized protein LOC132205676 n=1 Tax=Neocloeon triangulifer TaxID=2078957 RepID=UPI00286F0140|nr:uncharacterized protein LOC132205676 [Neocloeon triangulifer]